ncbi:MAG: WYL domain-containing protein [Clostridia bacterium]|nr:WYL domain-containing protein [Clostridia bacterium]
MNTKNNSRIQILKVLEILNKYSDCDHCINASQIEEKLLELGIKAERRSIYKDIAALNSCGYEINRGSSKKDGYYCDSREFELPEIRLLIDAVEGTPFITRKKTQQLKKHLLSLLSVYQAESFSSELYMDDRSKFKNEEIYYNVDRINEAIKNKKKIKFVYYHKVIKEGKLCNDSGREFIVSPYGLFWLDDRYYLAGNYEKYDTIANYRIDRMKKVEILDEECRNVSEVYSKELFDTAEYVRLNVEAFSGESEQVKLKFPPYLLDVITDKFGEDIEFVKKGNTSITTTLELNISDGLINWLLPYADKIEILYPEKLKSELIGRLHKINDFLKTDIV